MKLFRHGYQGKHERGQVPRQRDDDSRPRPAAGEREAKEGRERASDPEPGTGTRQADLPAQRRPAADEPADSSQPRW